jgi:hypothetical protein
LLSTINCSESHCLSFRRPHLTAVNAGSKTHSLNEDAALNLLLRTLKHDQVYAKRISLDCVTFDTEEKTDAYFQFALRENQPQSAAAIPTPLR